jgi:hypothetical protein
MSARTLATLREWKLARFTVRVTAHEDSDLDLSWDEDGSTLAALERGDVCSFGVRATVCLDGSEVGEDSLWGCIYANFAEFIDHKECARETRRIRAEGSKAVCGSYFADLIAGAIAEARKNVRRMQSVRVRS